MGVNVRLMLPGDEVQVAAMLSSAPAAMLYHSIPYKRLLSQTLPNGVEDVYLIALDGREICGLLPALIVDGPLGPCLNALPFFGSHGFPIAGTHAPGGTVQALYAALWQLCVDRGVSFATVIGSPFSSNDGAGLVPPGFSLRDNRIGQVTHLPAGIDPPAIEDGLFALYHQKTRNVVRKALSAELAYGHSSFGDELRALEQLHTDGMRQIGGIPKPPQFFKAIASELLEGTDYRVYTARTKSGEVVSAMLVLYFGTYVEYFVPATAAGWRSAQPLSGLIYVAMRDAVAERGATRWNWGGTWLSQDGVYQFKSRWGTTDYPYQYHTFVNERLGPVKEIRRIDLQNGYPWFYTLPYSVLKG